VLLPVLPERPRREQLRDEVDRRVRVVEPAVVEGHDVAVLELLEHSDLGKQPVALSRRAARARGLAHELGHADLVPGDLGALLLVKGLVDGLEGAAAEDLVELSVGCGVVTERERERERESRFVSVFFKKKEREREGRERGGRVLAAKIEKKRKKNVDDESLSLSHPAVAPRGVRLDHFLFLLFGLLMLLALWRAGRQRRLRLRRRRGRRRRHC